MTPPAECEKLRDAAIVAFGDMFDQPHPGRIGEALDALERWLRAELTPAHEPESKE